MPISFSCPHCQSKMTVPDSLAGKRGKCSKCKGNVAVPAADANGETAAAAAPVVAAAAAAPAPAAVDLEAEALAALVDEPQEQARVTEFVEFVCPQCDEPVKLALEHVGKKHPCPSCKRIISVPFPKDHKPKDWRDAGPKLPAAARRDDEPAPEGAWGSHTRTGASTEALKEAGVIKAKEKPLTFYQRFQPYMLIGAPVLLLAVGGLLVWGWIAAGKERRALEAALKYADSDAARKEVGFAGQAALHAGAAEYHLQTKTAAGHLSKALTLAAESGNSARNALLIDVVRLHLELPGLAEAAARQKAWDDTQKGLRRTLEAINVPEARLEAVRAASAGLIRHGETRRVLPLVAQVSWATKADQCEALAIAGLELLRQGNQDEAKAAAELASQPYTVDKERPELRSAVIALGTALGQKPIEPARGGLIDSANAAIGRAAGYAALGELDRAREEAGRIPNKIVRLRAFVAVAGATAKPDADLIAAAVDALGEVTDRASQELTWPLLRLLRLGVSAGVPAERLEAAAAAIPDPELRAWGRLLLLRARLAGSSATESAEALQGLPEGSLAGLVARLDLSRHNTRRDRGWAAAATGDWKDGPKAFASLGAALGMQKPK